MRFLIVLLLVSGCASTPPDSQSDPVKVELPSKAEMLLLDWAMVCDLGRSEAARCIATELQLCGDDDPLQGNCKINIKHGRREAVHHIYRYRYPTMP